MFLYRKIRSCWILESLLLFLVACSPYGDLALEKEESFASSDLRRTFADIEEKRVYKMDVEFQDRYFSGLLIIKSFGERSYRAVFMSEMGLSLFELSFDAGNFEVEHRLEKLDRNVVTTRIRKDLRLLLMSSIPDDRKAKLRRDGDAGIWEIDAGEDGTFFYRMEGDKLRKGTIVDGLWKKKKVSMELEGWGPEGPKRIHFLHQGPDLSLELKRVGSEEEDP